MLHKISIQNYALIDYLEIDFQKGLQVITGETGAGKSIILGALRLILGQRADLKSVADDTKKCIIEAEFEILNPEFDAFLKEHDVDVEPHCIIRRELLPQGKTRAFVNDSPVRLDVLQGISEYLIDVHSQFESENLFNEAYQFGLIDGLLESSEALKIYQSDFQKYKLVTSGLKHLLTEKQLQNNQKDYDLFLLGELQDLNLQDLNFSELQEQLSSLENAENIINYLSGSLVILQQENFGILPKASELIQTLNKISQHNSVLQDLNQRLQSNLEDLKDIALSLENQAEQTEVNPNLLLEIQSRYNQIQNLILKHQVKDFNELLEIQAQLEHNQNRNQDLDQKISSLEKEKSIIEKQLEKQAQILSDLRHKAIPFFQTKIEQSLHKLGLENAKITVDFSPTQEYTNFGKQQVQLLFQANKGYALKPIQTAISGGERSRVMLAIKALMAENNDLGTLVLDEIDTGVSGRIAEEMGNMMREMAQNRQLIVITHLAQVAAKGNTNYRVQKQEFEGKTQSTILKLSDDEKLHEIAQLLSGNQITSEAYNQAKTLIYS